MLKLLYFSAVLLAGSLSADADLRVLETDWLYPQVGSVGQQLGAEVKSITPQNAGGGVVLDLSLPIEHIHQFDGIEVFVETSGDSIPQSRPPQWMEDYEKGHHGLRLFLKRNPRNTFRIRLMEMDTDRS